MESTIHSEAEGKFIYPRIAEAEETRDITLEAVEEHNVAKTLLAGKMSKCVRKFLSTEDAESIAAEIEAFKEESSALEEPD